ncbi:hypothetical protein HC251_07840 [Iamia sp. SCSIO 61187]|uniref:hypothetical protein n=1 Tax=Iamia sp. SCSIO 61187 TaxID=2722752 RepID=UPI001C63A695|nr:hypothetical protein [Iamia sp. SCSIO 61187]QYG92360.1 hypothetical protein HC251_07840 [Iamia sp. SCSIO 61187]
MRELVLARADWMVVADPLGVDKALHVVMSGGLVVILAGRLGARRAAAVVLSVGLVLELVHGTLGTLGLELPSPLGGTAELADVVANLVGIGLGLLAVRTLGRRDGARTPGRDPGRFAAGR